MNYIETCLYYANIYMNIYESKDKCEDRLILAKIAIEDAHNQGANSSEFDKSLSRLINIYRTSELPREFAV